MMFQYQDVAKALKVPYILVGRASSKLKIKFGCISLTIHPHPPKILLQEDCFEKIGCL